MDTLLHMIAEGRFIRQRMGVAVALLGAVTVVHGVPSPESHLREQVNHLVDLGYEDPQQALASLRALEARLAQSAASRRIIEAGIGLVAADSGLSDEARKAIEELDRSIPTVGPIAHADSLLVRADLEASENQTQKSISDIEAAVAAYAPLCDPAIAPDVRGCNPFNWFYANMFAGVYVSEQDAHSSASIYLAAAQNIAEHANRPDLEARALAFTARLAQADGNSELSDRILNRAEVLAAQSRETSAQEFVDIFRSLVLKARGNLVGALKALQQAQEIARRAGHRRRTNDLIVDVVELELQQGHPDIALTEIDHALTNFESRHVGYMKETLSSDRIVALLKLGRLQEAKQTLPALLDALDTKAGPAERSGYVNEVGEALVNAGELDVAVALFNRERQAILVGSDRHFEHLILDHQAQLQSEQLLQRRNEISWWSKTGVVALLLLLIVGAVVPWQRYRNRRLELANDALRDQSERDPLTSLLNREGLLRGLRASARFDAFAGTLLLVDIDHFKKINDTLGHAGGDAVLREIAQRLQSCVREGDFVVRWGGEELVVAVLQPTFDADALVDRIMQSITTVPVSFQNRTIHVSASIGYGNFPLDETKRSLSFDESLAIADAGMYYAKRNGRSSAVRITELPIGLLADLGGLPAAVESEVSTGAVRLTIKRVAGKVADPVALTQHSVEVPVG